MKITLIFLLACMMFTGFSIAQRYANLSASVIGCQPDEIEIENESFIAIGGVSTWEASCKSKRYVCKYQKTTGVKCAEMFTPFVPQTNTADDSQ